MCRGKPCLPSASLKKWASRLPMSSSFLVTAYHASFKKS